MAVIDLLEQQISRDRLGVKGILINPGSEHLNKSYNPLFGFYRQSKDEGTIPERITML